MTLVGTVLLTVSILWLSACTKCTGLLLLLTNNIIIWFCKLALSFTLVEVYITLVTIPQICTTYSMKLPSNTAAHYTKGCRTFRAIALCQLLQGRGVYIVSDWLIYRCGWQLVTGVQDLLCIRNIHDEVLIELTRGTLSSNCIDSKLINKRGWGLNIPLRDITMGWVWQWGCVQ